MDPFRDPQNKVLAVRSEDDVVKTLSMPNSQAQSNDGRAKLSPVARMRDAVEWESRPDGLEPGEWGEYNRCASSRFASTIRSSTVVQARAIYKEKGTLPIVLAYESVPRKRASVYLDGEEFVRSCCWGVGMEHAIAVSDAAGDGVQRTIRPGFVAASSRDGLGMKKGRN